MTPLMESLMDHELVSIILALILVFLIDPAGSRTRTQHWDEHHSSG